MSWDKTDYRERSDEGSSHPTNVLEEGGRLLGLPLGEHTLSQFLRYQSELIDWNRRVNLTSITDSAGIQRRHFLDSLSCIAGAREQLQHDGCRVVDVGSGAGFPGLPLKLALPHIQLTLVEARGKRAAFLEHLIDALGLIDVTVVSERAETLGQAPSHRERYDVALARAVGSLAVVAELCLPLIRIGGRFVAPRRGDFELESMTSQPAFELLGGSQLEWVPVQIPDLDDGRGLVVSEKLATTPPRYPRRPGMAEKRPLA
jgi:16S rRNA (guanine527-N7)-methyltransferase